MRTKSLVGAFAGSLLLATALTPLRAADMTNDRALNPQREPQNWILHHGNYQGHRFSALKEINTDTVKNLKPAFTVALERLPERRTLRLRQSRGDAARRGRHHVRAGRLGLGLCDRRHRRQEGHHQVEDGPRHRPRLGGRRRLLRRQQPRRRLVEGQGDLDRARRPHVRHQQGDRRSRVGAQDRRARASARRSPSRR